MARTKSLESTGGYNALKRVIKQKRIDQASKLLAVKFSFKSCPTSETVDVILAKHVNIRKFVQFIQLKYLMSYQKASSLHSLLKSAMKSCTTGFAPTITSFDFVASDREDIVLDKETLLKMVDQMNKKERHHEQITVILEDKEKNEFLIRTDQDSHLLQLVDYAAVCVNTNPKKLRLMLGNTFCDPNSTPYKLKMDDGDTIRIYDMQNEKPEYLNLRRTKEPQISIVFNDIKRDEQVSMILDVFEPIHLAFTDYEELFDEKYKDKGIYLFGGQFIDPKETPRQIGMKKDDIVDVVWDEEINQSDTEEN